MKNIVGIIIGNTVNLSIDGISSQKLCKNKEEAKKIFELVLAAKEIPSDENLKKLHLAMRSEEKIIMSAIHGFSTNPKTGRHYLSGFDTPIPENIIEMIKEYRNNNWPIQSILNFWKLLMINPDKRIRKSLFEFMSTHDFVLTDTGYMLVYKCCLSKQIQNALNSLSEFVSNKYLHVKNAWTCSPNKYVVYTDNNLNLGFTKGKTIKNWNLKEKGVTVLGKLGDMFKDLITNAKPNVIAPYTDWYTKKMQIQLGIPVKMDRKQCDGDPANDCSFGLHVGATKYVETFIRSLTADGYDTVVLACLVNPAHVVAVPNQDHSKMRVSEYFPIALATYNNGKIEIVEKKYFESDYRTYEKQELNEMLKKVRLNEMPMSKAMNSKKDKRQMSELLKILETRLVDIE